MAVPDIVLVLTTGHQLSRWKVVFKFILQTMVKKTNLKVNSLASEVQLVTPRLIMTNNEINLKTEDTQSTC